MDVWCHLLDALYQGKSLEQFGRGLLYIMEYVIHWTCVVMTHVFMNTYVFNFAENVHPNIRNPRFIVYQKLDFRNVIHIDLKTQTWR